MSDNRLTKLTNTYVASLTAVDTPTTATLAQSSFEKWAPWTGSNRCPNCGSNKIEYNTEIILTTHPAQSQLRCKDCSYIFSSGFESHVDHFTDNNVWKHDQSILGKPQVGDWPPAPQVGDWPPYNEPEPPSYPDISIPNKHSQMGWICPKCGSCLAPHVNSCPHCSAQTQLQITY